MNNEPAELKTHIDRLISFGFCNIGEGRIARTNRNKLREAMAQDPRRFGFVKANSLRVASQTQLEDAWRRAPHVTEQFPIDEELASRFPASEKTSTLYARLSAEERGEIEDACNYIAGQQQLIAEKREADYRAELALIEAGAGDLAVYIEGALF
jgi:hypothetical protein